MRQQQLQNNYEYTFPSENQLGLGSNPTIAELVTGNFLNFIGEEIAPLGLGSGQYNYDNDSDIYLNLESCPGVSGTQGVNVFVAGITTESDVYIINELNNIFDGDNDLTCGKVRVDSNVLLFSISNN